MRKSSYVSNYDAYAAAVKRREDAAAAAAAESAARVQATAAAAAAQRRRDAKAAGKGSGKGTGGSPGASGSDGNDNADDASPSSPTAVSPSSSLPGSAQVLPSHCRAFLSLQTLTSRALFWQGSRSRSPSPQAFFGSRDGSPTSFLLAGMPPRGLSPRGTAAAAATGVDAEPRHGGSAEGTTTACVVAYSGQDLAVYAGTCAGG